MRWTEYVASILLFSVVSMLVLYVMQRLQSSLPFNAQGFAGVAPDLAFNTAASFTTNTNWQAYSGESTMSDPTQMAGLAYHNFVSAAADMAVAIAFIRGIAQKEKETPVDLVTTSASGFDPHLHRPPPTSRCPAWRANVACRKRTFAGSSRRTPRDVNWGSSVNRELTSSN